MYTVPLHDLNIAGNYKMDFTAQTVSPIVSQEELSLDQHHNFIILL